MSNIGQISIFMAYSPGPSDELPLADSNTVHLLVSSKSATFSSQKSPSLTRVKKTLSTLGHKHKLDVTFLNKMSRVHEEINSDQKLLEAIDIYWDLRRLSLQVCVMKKDEFDSMHDIEW